ncbi:MAG TPA: L-threonylcarbamoyladenylate synthase [Bacteroidales bacterium]|nr:L-threonylcarbamoyladenylate synthase [Bacteroidales bacterium]
MDEEINSTVSFLKKGRIILYPTDTIWGIGCDATMTKPVDQIYRLKQRAEKKSMIILLDSAEKLAYYIRKVPSIAYDLLERYLEPLTIIYPGAMNVAKNVIADDGSIAIRIVRDEFCRKMIEQLGKPVVSTSANLSGQPAPLVFSKIAPEIKNGVDYIVNYNRDVMVRSKPSTIIRLLGEGEFEVLRK